MSNGAKMKCFKDRLVLLGVVLFLFRLVFAMNTATDKAFPHGGNMVWDYSPYFWVWLFSFVALCFLIQSKQRWVEKATYALAAIGYFSFLAYIAKVLLASNIRG